MKILLLEDDVFLKELLEDHLEQNYEVIGFEDGLDAYEYLYEHKVDLALLDINVPNLKGDELLQKLRDEQNKTPVIFITSNNSSKDVKHGFEIGCDDYIKKPFEFDELDARIEHIKNIYSIDQTITINNFVFDPKKHTVYDEQNLYTLTPKASEILLYLYKNKNKAISKDELIENIWGYDEIPNDATIRSHIRDLRKIFPDNIETIRSVGYVFKQV